MKPCLLRIICLFFLAFLLQTSYGQDTPNSRWNGKTPEQLKQSGKKLVLIGTLAIPTGIGVAALALATEPRSGSDPNLRYIFTGFGVGGVIVLTGITLIVIGKAKQHKAKLIMNSVSYERPFGKPGKMLTVGLALPFH